MFRPPFKAREYGKNKTPITMQLRPGPRIVTAADIAAEWGPDTASSIIRWMCEYDTNRFRIGGIEHEFIG